MALVNVSPLDPQSHPLKSMILDAVDRLKLIQQSDDKMLVTSVLDAETITTLISLAISPIAKLPHFTVSPSMITPEFISYVLSVINFLVNKSHNIIDSLRDAIERYKNDTNYEGSKFEEDVTNALKQLTLLMMALPLTVSLIINLINTNIPAEVASRNWNIASIGKDIVRVIKRVI
jgi:hypothetical protein